MGICADRHNTKRSMTIGTDMAKMLAEVVDRDIRIMHVCGTHEAAIAKYGIRSVLPPQLKIVMGCSRNKDIP